MLVFSIADPIISDALYMQGEPFNFTLTDKDDDEKKSTVVVEARYLTCSTLEAMALQGRSVAMGKAG